MANSKSITPVGGFHLPVSQYAPNRTLAHFVITTTSRIGVTEEVSKVLTRNNVNILSGIQDAPVNRDATWSFFADVTDAALPLDKVADELMRLPDVRDVKFRLNGIIGFIVDAFHFPTLMNERQMMMMSAASVKEIFGHIREILGGGRAADVLIHQMGIANGYGISEGIQSMFGKRPSREMVEEFFHLIRGAGWGVETLEEFDYEASTARVRVANCAECAFYGHSSNPQSQFVRGTYSGVFQRLFEKPVTAKEVSCIAKGDAYCEFEVKPH